MLDKVVVALVAAAPKIGLTTAATLAPNGSHRSRAVAWKRRYLHIAVQPSLLPWRCVHCVRARWSIFATGLVPGAIVARRAPKTAAVRLTVVV